MPTARPRTALKAVTRRRLLISSWPWRSAGYLLTSLLVAVAAFAALAIHWLVLVTQLIDGGLPVGMNSAPGAEPSEPKRSSTPDGGARAHYPWASANPTRIEGGQAVQLIATATVVNKSKVDCTVQKSRTGAHASGRPSAATRFAVRHATVAAYSPKTMTWA